MSLIESACARIAGNARFIEDYQAIVRESISADVGLSHKSTLALRWMRGEPLPSIIEGAISYHKRQGKNRSNRTVIREVLTDVESDLRFRYVNLLGCYSAVLRRALLDTKHDSSIMKIPALTLYLELGAASQTMIQLMSFGLSRHTASAVANLTINKDMDAAAAKAFLQRLQLQTLSFSPYLTEELRRVIASV